MVIRCNLDPSKKRFFFGWIRQPFKAAHLEERHSDDKPIRLPWMAAPLGEGHSELKPTTDEATPFSSSSSGCGKSDMHQNPAQTRRHQGCVAWDSKWMESP